MKTLEQYAEEWSSDYTYANGKQDVAKESFIACGESDWVKTEKIKAQIEVYKNIRLQQAFEVNVSTLNYCQVKVTELEQQLKELENGKKDN